jgi:hypothetical protein
VKAALGLTDTAKEALPPGSVLVLDGVADNEKSGVV